MIAPAIMQSAVWPLPADGSSGSDRTTETTRLHPMFSAAFEAIIRARAEQVDVHGHDAAGDDAIGAHALTHMSYRRILQVEQQMLRQAHTAAGDTIDSLSGNPDRIARMSGHELAVAYGRMANAAALLWAAMDVLDRARTLDAVT